MKKTILALLAVSVSLGALAQGTVVFNNRVTGTIFSRVYAPEVGSESMAKFGNTAESAPLAGTQTYSGLALSGSGYVAQLFGGVGYNLSGDALTASSQTTVFRTGAAAGQVVAITGVLTGIPGDTAQATLQLRVWDNSSGLYATWAQAEQAWLAGTIAAGMSATWNQDKIGGQANPAPNLANSTDLNQRLQSFNIYVVPEPGTIALAGLGVAALVAFRRRK